MGGESRSDLGRHAGDALRCDVPTQNVAAQFRILLVLQVGDSAPKTSFIFDVGRLKLSEDLWRPQGSRSTHRQTHTHGVYTKFRTGSLDQRFQQTEASAGLEHLLTASSSGRGRSFKHRLPTARLRGTLQVGHTGCRLTTVP